MTKTTNYQLPQWEANDPVRREDFNAAWEKVDAALTAVHVVDSYTGDGQALDSGGQLIDLGFTPGFVIISRGWTSSNGGTGAYFLAVGAKRTTSLDNTFTLDDSGFRVGTGNGGLTLNLNAKDVTYSYIAFR